MVVFITKTLLHSEEKDVCIHSLKEYYVLLICQVLFLGWENKSEQNRQKYIYLAYILM